MEISIRAYNKKDKRDCIVAFKSNVPLYFTDEEIRDFENFLERIENVDIGGSQIKTHYCVVLDGHNVIGCGGFGDKDGKEIISLAWGLIHKDYHKKGLGIKLLTHRLEQIKMLYPTLALVLDTTQYSYRFFEKYGFCTTKITNDYYAPGMHRYDMVLKG